MTWWDHTAAADLSVAHPRCEYPHKHVHWTEHLHPMQRYNLSIRATNSNQRCYQMMFIKWWLTISKWHNKMTVKCNTITNKRIGQSYSLWWERQWGWWIPFRFRSDDELGDQGAVKGQTWDVCPSNSVRMWVMMVFTDFCVWSTESEMKGDER